MKDIDVDEQNILAWDPGFTKVTLEECRRVAEVELINRLDFKNDFY